MLCSACGWLVDFPFLQLFLFAAESTVDFLFEFLEPSQSPLGGFDAVDNRPKAGKGNRTLYMPTQFYLRQHASVDFLFF